MKKSISGATLAAALAISGCDKELPKQAPEKIQNQVQQQTGSIIRNTQTKEMNEHKTEQARIAQEETKYAQELSNLTGEALDKVHTIQSLYGIDIKGNGHVQNIKESIQIDIMSFKKAQNITDDTTLFQDRDNTYIVSNYGDGEPKGWATIAGGTIINKDGITLIFGKAGVFDINNQTVHSIVGLKTGEIRALEEGAIYSERNNQLYYGSKQLEIGANNVHFLTIVTKEYKQDKQYDGDVWCVNQRNIYGIKKDANNTAFIYEGQIGKLDIGNFHISTLSTGGETCSVNHKAGYYYNGKKYGYEQMHNLIAKKLSNLANDEQIEIGVTLSR